MLKFIKRNVRIIKSFPFIKFNRAFQPSLVIVEDLEHICRTDVEILLYQKLRRHMYYPTPHYRVNHIVVNIALIPFRVALIEQHNGVDEKQLKKYLNRKAGRLFSIILNT
ncbi:hypothetical protein [Bacillus sp. JCM 19034]|uniref:hypothetical protein n=1 Tax=Bacillus sp. JCM 19034 TaxID=1481928 RepID=UPI0007860975|nr:hypothetical protein [Bacillus sp. JCM 19034]